MARRREQATEETDDGAEGVVMPFALYQPTGDQAQRAQLIREREQWFQARNIFDPRARLRCFSDAGRVYLGHEASLERARRRSEEAQHG